MHLENNFKCPKQCQQYFVDWCTKCTTICTAYNLSKAKYGNTTKIAFAVTVFTHIATKDFKCNKMRFLFIKCIEIKK